MSKKLFWILSLVLVAAVLAWLWFEFRPKDTTSSFLDQGSGEMAVYANDAYRFSLQLPAAWQGYRAFTAADDESEGAIVLLSLPVERYAGVLEAPQDLANGVIVAGIEIFSKEYVSEQRAFCDEEQELIDRYQVAMSQGRPFEGTGEDQDFIDDCLSLRDPQSANEAVRAAFLGENDQSYFFRVPLDQFDNGFREVPTALKAELEAVYGSFQAR